MIGTVNGASEEGLVSYWSFDDGTAKDNAGNNDGTIYGAQVVNGISGKALEFDGIDDYIDCGNDESLDITNEITIEAWVKWNDISERQRIVMKYGVGGDSYDLSIWDIGGGIQTYSAYTTNGWQHLPSGITPNINEWYYVVYTYDGSTIKLYVNLQEFSKNLTDTISSSTSPVNIGRNPVPSHAQYFKGTIDEVKIYNRALTEDEIKEDFCFSGTLCGGTCYNTSGKCCSGVWYSGTNRCCSNSDCTSEEYCSSNSCTDKCGNGICESGETCSSCPCDCGCSSGKLCCAGNCITPVCSSNSNCSDGNPCTIDSCSNARTCSASCSHTTITSCLSGDGCCPSGCNSVNDNDCSVSCGNNICESGETCSSCPGDCGCSSGKICCAGSCVIPNCNSNSECNDGNSCTVDSCSNAGTCSASCSHTTINSCVGGDGCCSSGCNSANDNDCSASCGNDICDSGEDYNNCLQDCPAPIVCGDEICAESETAISCPQDCDLCYGMVCDSYCSGRLRYHEGTCLNGECVYQTEECSCRCEGGYCTTDPDDRDCDGVTSDVDCDDSNSQNKNRRDLDSDGDGGNDCIDKCPDSKGPASTGYCPCAITERCDNCLELGVGEHCDCNEECKSKYCLSKSGTCISVPLQPAIDIQVLSAVSRSPGKITFQVTNKLNNPKIIGKMEIKIPDDVEIHNTVNVEDLGTRGLLGFNIPSGSEKHISVEFSSNNPGDFRFSGEVYWWYEGDDENKHHESLDKTVTIWQFCGGEYCSPDKYCGEDKKCHAEEKADVGASKEEEASPAGVQKEKEDSIWRQNPLFIIAIALIIVVVIFVLKSGKSKAIVRIKETGHEGTDLPETKPLQGIKTKPEIKTQKTTESDEKVINTCKFCGIQIPRKYEYCYDCIKHKKMQDMQRDIPREIKTDDTHLVRSMPELLIDNWLYHHNIKHEVEKKLPIKELRYCDWYLADYDLYIEYWGMMNDESYRKSKKIKEKIYKKNRLKLLGLEQKDIQNLDEIIRFKLEQFGIKLD